MSRKQKDTPIQDIASMDREALVAAILKMDCEFPIDLTAEYLRSLSLEKLRHIHTALRSHARKASPPGS